MSLRAKILLSVAALAAMVSQGRTDGIGRQMPRRAYDFVNSIGVNTHFGYYDTQYGLYEEVLRPRLLELGVKHIRDGTFNDDVARKYRDVGESGVRLLLITSAERVAGQAEAIGPMLWGVEAENEPDGRGGEWVFLSRLRQRSRVNGDAVQISIVAHQDVRRKAGRRGRCGRVAGKHT